MAGILGIGASGLQAQQRRLDLIANNIANVDTPGYKESQAATQDDTYAAVRIAAVDPEQHAIVGADFWLGQGVQVAGTPRYFRQGAVDPTQNPLDLAIIGDGFFPIRLPDGNVAYGRDGRFNMDPQGNLVNASGNLLDTNIVVPANVTQVSVDASGNVMALDPTTGQPQQLGTIQLAQFANSQGLEAIGGNLFRETVSSGPAQLGQAGTAGYGQIMSGALEASNVDLAQQFTRMMEAQRAYQAAARVIRTTDDMMGLANAMPR
ncbi:MAG: flagellar basal-body rod protein FlgG [Chloroflexota bacterium]|nr:MAG: flagellar basal-body rod protein FlgG [Chloroflexota bacterium]